MRTAESTKLAQLLRQRKFIEVELEKRKNTRQKPKLPGSFQGHSIFNPLPSSSGKHLITVVPSIQIDYCDRRIKLLAVFCIRSKMIYINNVSKSFSTNKNLKLYYQLFWTNSDKILFIERGLHAWPHVTAENQKTLKRAIFTWFNLSNKTIKTRSLAVE